MTLIILLGIVLWFIISLGWDKNICNDKGSNRYGNEHSMDKTFRK